MDLDLNSLSLKELKDLQVSVARTISNFEERKRREAIATLEAVARENGFSLSELVGAGMSLPTRLKGTRSPAEPKYANPHNKSDTWSGRGRKPLWFQAALDKGKKPEDMHI